MGNNCVGKVTELLRHKCLGWYIPDRYRQCTQERVTCPMAVIGPGNKYRSAPYKSATGLTDMNRHTLTTITGGLLNLGYLGNDRQHISNLYPFYLNYIKFDCRFIA